MWCMDMVVVFGIVVKCSCGQVAARRSSEGVCYCT